MNSSPFEQLKRELDPSNRDVSSDDGLTLDTERRARCGLPEIVYCSEKTPKQIAEALSRLCDANGRAIGTRLDPDAAGDVARELEGKVAETKLHEDARAVVVHNNADVQRLGGRVALVTAGSSDWPVAAEAALIAREAGCEVRSHRDVGVAGIHRIVRPIEDAADWDCDVIIVAAGMDGVLPTVVAGLVDVPVIGLPTSTGYGLGGDGIGAITTMLQACAPGVSVVNIDNGVGAGATAALIANRAALFRDP